MIEMCGLLREGSFVGSGAAWLSKNVLLALVVVSPSVRASCLPSLSLFSVAVQRASLYYSPVLNTGLSSSPTAFVSFSLIATIFVSYLKSRSFTIASTSPYPSFDV